MIDWDCADCGADTREEYYMVHDHLWEQFGSEPFLCIGCLEDRMGRALWSGDFTHWPVNNVNQWNKSDRLVDRLTSVGSYVRGTTLGDSNRDRAHLDSPSLCGGSLLDRAGRGPKENQS